VKIRRGTKLPKVSYYVRLYGRFVYLHSTFGYSHSLRSQGTMLHDTLCAHTHTNNVTTFNWQCTIAPNGRRRIVSIPRQIFIVTLCVFNGCLCKCLGETHWFKWANLCNCHCSTSCTHLTADPSKYNANLLLLF